MTRDEAKQWIESIKRKYIHGGDEEFDYKRKIALDMAIEALQQELCEDAISRKAAIEAMEYCDFTKSENDELVLYEDDVIEALKSLPSVNPQKPETGHWEDSNVFLMAVIGDTVVHLPAKECSICHKPHIKGYGADFCPNCGAKMSEREASDDKV